MMFIDQSWEDNEIIYLTKATVFRFRSTTIPVMRRLKKYLHIDRPQLMGLVKLRLGC